MNVIRLHFPKANISAARKAGHHLRLCANNQKGSAMVELAMVLPVLMLIVTGILSFGFTLNNYLELTNAVTMGAQQLAISRGITPLDPCALTSQTIQNAAPYLTPGGLTLTVTFTPQSGTGTYTSTGTSCSGGAPYVVQGESALVTATYPCSLAVYGANLVPGCKLHAQIAEIVQ